MPKFNIEEEYDKWLAGIGMSKEKMHPNQYSMMEQAFMAGQLVQFKHLTGGISEQSESEAVQSLNDLQKQFEDYSDRLLIMLHQSNNGKFDA